MSRTWSRSTPGDALPPLGSTSTCIPGTSPSLLWAGDADEAPVPGVRGYYQLRARLALRALRRHRPWRHFTGRDRADHPLPALAHLDERLIGRARAHCHRTPPPPGFRPFMANDRHDGCSGENRRIRNANCLCMPSSDLHLLRRLLRARLRPRKSLPTGATPAPADRPSPAEAASAKPRPCRDRTIALSAATTLDT